MFESLEQYKKSSKKQTKKPTGIDKQSIKFDCLYDCQTPSMIPGSQRSFVDKEIIDWVNGQGYGQENFLELLPNFSASQFEQKAQISKKQNQDTCNGKGWVQIIAFDSKTNSDDFIRVVSYQHQGWCIIIQQFGKYLAVGNSGSHPFVMTPKFQFGNSDGSTWDGCPSAKNPEQIINASLEKAKEFVMRQAH